MYKFIFEILAYIIRISSVKQETKNQAINDLKSTLKRFETQRKNDIKKRQEVEHARRNARDNWDAYKHQKGRDRNGS